MSVSMAELVRQSRNETPSPASKEPVAEATDAVDEYVSYAKLRGPRQAAFMVEFRTAAGDSEAFDYGLLARCVFDRSAGLTLLFAAGKVVIRGKNLRPLFDAILAHRVLWVAVVDPPIGSAIRDPDATVVTGIEIDAAGG